MTYLYTSITLSPVITGDSIIKKHYNLRKIIMKNLTLLLFLIGLSLSSFAQDIDLFIWAGQSNAKGSQGDASQYPDDPNNLDEQILFNWTVIDGESSDGWGTMEPQVGSFIDGHFGPEVSFSRSLAEAGYNPAIFKYTKGATSIYQHWLTPGDGGFYDDMILKLNTAINELESLGYTVNIRGFVWIQGESDSNSPEAAAAYFNNISSIIDDIRIVTDNSSLPILLSVDEKFFIYSGHEQPEILNAHQNIALNDDTIKFTSMYGFPKADYTHLTPAGLVMHGESIFGTYQRLISGETPSSNSTIYSYGGIVSSVISKAWGQSFNSDLSGMLTSITFRAASALNNTATFTLHHGADCSSEILLTKSLSEIIVGDNIINFDSDLYLDKEHTYYINITSDTDAEWQVYFNSSSTVFGNLKTNNSDESTTSCRRNFYSYDLSFSVEISESTLGTSELIKNSVIVFPNPTNGIVNLNINNKTSVIVYNSIGQIVYRNNAIYRRFELNTKPGLYIIDIHLEDGTSEKKKLVIK